MNSRRIPPRRAWSTPGPRRRRCWRVLPALRSSRACGPATEGRKNQPDIAALHGLRVLRLNGAIGDDLGFLAELAHLRILGLESLKTSSVRGIEALRRVECLVIDHAQRLTSLDPIANLDELRHLSISTPASWDPARRCIEVDTLAPLGELARLEHLTLRGVRPSADGLRPLERLKALWAVDISHVPDFGLEDFARLAGALPHAAGICLQPHFRMNFPWPCSVAARRRNG